MVAVTRSILILLLAGILVRPVRGFDDPSPGSSDPQATGVVTAWILAQSDGAPDSDIRVDPAKEAAALRFLGDKFPELADLVSRLKRTDAGEYAAAIRDLHATYANLERLRVTDRRRYVHELQAWQVQSRIDIVVARLTVDPNINRDKRLRSLLSSRFELRRQWLLSEQQEHLRRADELGAEADKILDRKEELVDNALGQLLREVERARAAEAEAKDMSREPSPADDSATVVPETADPDIVVPVTPQPKDPNPSGD